MKNKTVVILIGILMVLLICVNAGVIGYLIYNNSHDSGVCNSVVSCKNGMYWDSKTCDCKYIDGDNNNAVEIVLPKTEFSQGEDFEIKLVANQEVYYYPESCAGSLLDINKIENGKSEEYLTYISGSIFSCDMQPFLQLFSEGEEITYKFNDAVEFEEGTYVVTFTYYLDKLDDTTGSGKIIVKSEEFNVK